MTVKFSEQFYRKLGHEAVDELVNWFNQVDRTYRGDLREINELNFSRFDAKLEQRVVQLEAKLEQRVAQLEAKLEQRAAQLDTKLEQRLGELRAELGALRGELRAELGELRGEFQAQLEAQGKTLMRWMIGLWIAGFGMLGGLILAVLRFLPAARP